MHNHPTHFTALYRLPCSLARQITIVPGVGLTLPPGITPRRIHTDGLIALKSKKKGSQGSFYYEIELSAVYSGHQTPRYAPFLPLLTDSTGEAWLIGARALQPPEPANDTDCSKSPASQAETTLTLTCWDIYPPMRVLGAIPSL